LRRVCSQFTFSRMSQSRFLCRGISRFARAPSLLGFRCVLLLLTFDGPISYAFEKEAVEARVSALMEQFQVPGVSIAVVEENRIAWTHGWGVKKKGVDDEDRVDESILFEAASMSKPLFAYAVLKLVEQGRRNIWIRLIWTISRITN